MINDHENIKREGIIMNKKLENFIEQIKNFDQNLNSIYLKGSMQDETKMDYWSDTDLLIITKTENIKDLYVKELDEVFHPIHAKQLYDYSGCITYRVTSFVEETILQYDIQIITQAFFNEYQNALLSKVQHLYGEESKIEINDSVQQNYHHHYDESAINNLWFCFYETTKKLCRKDNLMSLHLIFEIVREYLVLKMIDRDIEKGSNIHRYGQSESLPNTLDLNLLQTSDVVDKLKILLSLANEFDKKLCEIYDEYESRSAVFNQHIQNSIELVRT